MTNHPPHQHHGRRERRIALEASQRTSRTSPTTRRPTTLRRAARPAVARPRRIRLKATGSFLAIALIATTYMLPAYADTLPVAVTTPNAAVADLQSLSISDELDPEATTRDSYMILRTNLGGYQPYEHLANTFANNPNSSVQWPFEVGVPISSWFGFRDCAGCGSNHQGIDLNPGEGTPIQAIADGVVTEIGNPSGPFGVYAKIAHQIDGQNVSSLYAHMLQGSLALAVGDTVTKGQLVGQVGSTGQSTGPHLHFGIYLDGVTAIDPYPWMKEKVGS